jgi:WD40 repeat protein
MVTNVIFSPNGQVLASGSIDNSLRLWRTADGEPLQSLLGSPRPMARLAFSPDGKILASERFNIISIWQVETGKLLHEIIQPYESSQNMLSLVFSPNGQILASGSMDNTICLWNVADSELLNTLKGHMGVVTSIVFSPDGQTLASGSGDKTVRLWRVVSGELLYMLEGHTDFVTDVAFSPDGKTLASGSYDDSANLWRVADGKLVHSLKGSADVKDIAFSPDGNILALGSMREIQLWQVADGKQLQTLELERSAPQASRIIFSPNGQFFAWGASDYTVGVWSTSDGNKVSSLVCGGKMISASISPDGILAAGLENGTICLKPIQGFINE